MSATRKPAIAAQNERERSRMRRLSPKQGRALLRRAALLRIGQWWHANGIEPSNLDDVALIIADTAVFAYGGLTIETFNHLARKMRLRIPREVADCALDHAFSKLMQCDADNQYYPMLSDAEVGRLLGLTRFERRAIEADFEQMAKRVRLPKDRRFVTTISTILGTDETPDDLKAERAERRRQKERERQKRNRRRAYKTRKDRERRAKAGATPRSQCLSQTKPWEAFGICRDTWYRRGRPSPSDKFADNPPRKTPGKPAENGQTNSRTACIPKGSDNYRRGGQLVSEQDAPAALGGPLRVPPDEARTFLEIISEGRRDPPKGARCPERTASKRSEVG